MRTLFCALASLMLCASIASAADVAWWVSARFEATGTTIESIPVRDLDRTWVAASPLREPDLPPAAFHPGETLKDHDAAFQVQGDFDHDGKQDKALVGVYRTVTGATGGFLLILTRTATGRWTKAALFKNPNGGFSAITRQRGRLVWVFCFECDGRCAVISSRRRWTLRCDRE